jgi:hypothetical protein
MINKLSSPAPTYKAPVTTGKQEWGVAKNAKETTPAKPVETTPTETRPQTKVTPTETALTPKPKNTLNPLRYGNTNLGTNFNSSLFTPAPINWNDPQVQNTMGVLEANTFIPDRQALGLAPTNPAMTANPYLGLPATNTNVTANPYDGANGSLGSSVFSNSLGLLGLG